MKVGLIGCGVMGELYARVVTECELTDLVVACDVDAQRAADLATRWNVPQATDRLERLLESLVSVGDQGDGAGAAAIVATPDFAHCEPVCRCLTAGLPVLCEKPLATSLQDADAMVQAARQSRQPLMVNFGNRHRLNARRVRDLVREGTLGRVQHVAVQLNERLCKTRTIPWLARTTPVWFLLSHCVDLVRWLLEDDFGQVYARATHGVVDRLAPGVPDMVSALCTTTGGVTVTLHSTWALPDGYSGNIDFALQIIGEEGIIQAALFPHDLQLHTSTGCMAQDHSMDVVLPGGETAGWWQSSTRSFFQALAVGDLPSPDGQEAREVTRTLLALEASWREGRPVCVGGS